MRHDNFFYNQEVEDWIFEEGQGERGDKAKGQVGRDWLARSMKVFADGCFPDGCGKVGAVGGAGSFSECFQRFLDAHDFSASRLNQYRVVERAVLRFEGFVRATVQGRENYVFDVGAVGVHDMEELYDFMSKEHICGKPFLTPILNLSNSIGLERNLV